MESATEPEVDHARTYEHLLRMLYLSWRATTVIAVGCGAWNGRRTYQCPRAMGALWLVLASESTWSTIRSSKLRRVDRSGLWADTATVATVLGLLPRAYGALEGGDVDEWRHWGTALAEVQAEAVSFATTGWRERAAAAAVLAAAMFVGATLGPDKLKPADLATAAATFTFRMVLTGLLTDIVKGNVDRLNSAHEDAVRAAGDRAQLRARSRYVAYMQGRALRVLDSIATSASPRDGMVRRAAAVEAAGLRRLLLPETGGETAGLAAILDEVTRSGIDVEVVMGAVDPGFEFPEEAAEALRDRLLSCAVPARHGVRRVVLFVDVVGSEVLATIRGVDVRHELRVAL